MSSTARMIGKRFDYADYATWPGSERWEIIDGEAYDMTPSPSFAHQQIVGRLFFSFETHLREKKCVPILSPFDVIFDETNIVQPDLLVVCDHTKISEANVHGAPDLVIEVISPSTKLKDKREKKALYERFGVGEYLLFHPEDGMVDRYRLSEGRYLSEDVFNWDETLTLALFPELTLNLWEIFGRELPPPPSTSPA